MDEQFDTVTANTQALATLKQAAEMIRNNGKNRYKGVTTELRKQWKLSITTLFSTPQFDVELLWDDLSLLPNEVMVEGVTSAWENMSAERRQIFQNRLKLLPPEKGAIQRLQLVLKLLDSAPLDALRFFSNIAPRHAETVKHAGNLLALDYQRIQQLFSPDAETPLLSQAIGKMVMLIENDSIGSNPRWAAAKAILCSLANRKLLSAPIFSDSIQKLMKIAIALPSMQKEDLRRLFGDYWLTEEAISKTGSNNRPDSLASVITNEGDMKQGKSDEAPESSPINSAVRAKSEEDSKSTAFSDPKVVAAQLREMLKMQVDLLDNFLLGREQSELNELRRELQQVREAERRALLRAEEQAVALDNSERKSEKLAEKSQIIQDQFEKLNARIQGIESEQQDLLRQRESLRSEIQSNKNKHAQEIEELTHRISASTEAGLDEFRKRIASELHDLLSDTPEHTAHVDEELGRILLTRIHQVMDRMERAGMKVRSRGKVL
jgi:hypothetical protein